MSKIHLAKVCDSDPTQFQAKYNDSKSVLLPEAVYPKDDARPAITSESEIAIIGAGFGGLASALMCKKKLKTDDFVVFEKHAEWGGTWWANTYPGCASDIPALWYLLYDEITDNWSDIRPPQPEMEEYILSVVNKYDLHRRTKLETAVHLVTYNEATGKWVIEAANMKSGQRLIHTARIVMSCLGGLVYPNKMNLPGLENFQGDYMHSAVWNHDVDFKDKDVIVIGNGCLAAQVVPALMDELDVKRVLQVVRSKHWIMPPHPRLLYRAYQLLSGTRLGLVFLRFFVIAVAESRYPLYRGSNILSRLVRKINTYVATKYITSQAPVKYHDMLLPDYKIGCKRLIFDYKYVPLLKNPKFDMTTSPITEVTADHVHFADGQKVTADIIVMCTGYNVVQSTRGFQIVGKGGRSLQERWAEEGVSAYRTVLPPDCPNYFMIGGPNSATGHSSVVTAIENGVAYAERVMRPIVQGKAKLVMVKPAVYENWFKTTQKRLSESVFGTAFGGCTSWYSENGVNATAYPYLQLYYWFSLRFGGYGDLVYDKESKKNV